MRPTLLTWCLCALLCLSHRAAAQDTPPPSGGKTPAQAPAKDSEAPASPKQEAAPEPESGSQDAPGAQPEAEEPTEGEAPSEDAPQEEAGASAAAEAEAEGSEQAGQVEAGGTTPPPLPPPDEAAESLEIPSPGELGDRLSDQMPEAVVVREPWTAPTPILTLHGYMRARGELLHKHWLDRAPIEAFGGDGLEPNSGNAAIKAGQGPDPFTRYRPAERLVTADVAGNRCPGQSVTTDSVPNASGDGYNSVPTCDSNNVSHANMRLRLSPQLNVSEDVRVKMTFDIFDNLNWGGTPKTFYGAGALADTTFVSTSVPGEELNLFDTIVARRAWAEVRNRDLGELRFGRMPQHWGTGMLYNAGDRLDDDFSTDVDRVLGITKIFGFYLSASYDFMFQGKIQDSRDRPQLDEAQIDDMNQFTFSAAYRREPEEIEAILGRGDPVVNVGLQFQMRFQNSLYNAPPDEDSFIKANSEHFTPDLWAQLLWGPLRIEGEIAAVLGGMDNYLTDSTDPKRYGIAQFGYTLESELRFFDEKLGIYFYHGMASGDADVEGLSSESDFVTQLLGADSGRTGDDGVVSTFRFHPSYRVDMILWRQIMRQVTGAYYFKPGVSYDFLRSDFGQLLGGRFDVIYSRAHQFLQTWGNDPNLGVELNFTLYYSSEDGAGLTDGYHAMVQYGVMFPLKGLGYRHDPGVDLDAAQQVRAVLGVSF